MRHPGYALVPQEDKLLLLLPKKSGSLLTPVTKSHSLLSCQVLSPTRSSLPHCVPCGVHLQPSYELWFSPVTLLSHELQGSEKVWKTLWHSSPWRQAICTVPQALFFARHVTNLAVLCHCVEEDGNKGLFHGQPVVPARGIGAAGAHYRENKDSEQSVLCLQCGKGASEGTSCF